MSARTHAVGRGVSVALSLTFSVAAAFTAAVPLPAAFQGPQAHAGLAAVVAASGAAPAAQTAADLEAAVAQTASLNALRVWLDAVTLHRPGEADLPAAVVASSSDELEQLLPALVHYLDYARTTEIARQKAGQRGVNVAGTASCQPCGASSRERQRLLRETRSRAPLPERFRGLPLPGTLNDLIIRGVMLHSDAAVRLHPGPQVPRTIAALEASR